MRRSLLVGNVLTPGSCLEDLVPGAAVAVLTCLCSLHEPCARAWLVRGKGCPVHARDV